MNYVWELIKTIVSSFLSGNNRKENRDDYKVAYDGLFKLTQIMEKRIDKQEEQIKEYSEKIEELEDVKYVARRLEFELEKIKIKLKECQEAYLKEQNK